MYFLNKINYSIFAKFIFVAIVVFSFFGTFSYAHQDAQIEKKISELSVESVNENKPFLQNTIDFIALGIKHILIGPDHILFVISIVLVLLPIRKILLMVSTFTLAHSLTFILAGTEVITLSSKIVEPIIALSIAYMAITTVFFKNVKFFGKIHSRLSVIFIFGLFHGLGFASMFNDLQIPSNRTLSSLVFFNVGVEIGQMLILLLVIPILLLVKKNKEINETFTEIIATLISIIAIFWFIQRIFF